MSSITYNKLNLNSVSTANKDKVILNTSDYNGARFFSLSVTPNSVVNSDTYFNIRKVVSNNDLRIVNSGGKYVAVLFDNTGTIRVLISSVTPVIGVEAVLSFNIDATTGMEFCVNGISEVIDSSFKLALDLPSGITRIGEDISTGARNPKFTVKNFKSYNISRDASTVLATLNDIPDAGEVGLIECFPFLNETGDVVTGVKGLTGTITTLNAGGVTHIDNVIREDYTVIIPDPIPTGNEFLQKQILKATNQLYPTGRSFNLLDGTTLNKLHKALAKSESQAFEDAKGILNHILPDNANFLEDDAALWENRLGLITNTAVSLADRKLAIQRKMNQPGEYPAKQSWDYLEEQLQAAGFTVYVHENIPEVDIYDFLITNNIARFGPNRMGTFRYNSTVPNYNSLFDVIRMNTVRMGTVRFNQKVYLNKVVNHIEEQKDAYFPIAGNFRSTFFVGGITKGDFANVPLARKEEFRQLILKIKPAQTIGYLLINYV